MGTSPVSTFDGKVKKSWSNPGKSVETLVPAVIAVPPTVTLTEFAATPRIPVNEIRKTVGTCVPEPLSDVMLKGSGKHPGVNGFVALHTTARPPGPGGGGVMKMSGCAGRMVINPRMTVPLLLITIG